MEFSFRVEPSGTDPGGEPGCYHGTGTGAIGVGEARAPAGRGPGTGSGASIWGVTDTPHLDLLGSSRPRLEAALVARGLPSTRALPLFRALHSAPGAELDALPGVGRPTRRVLAGVDTAPLAIGDEKVQIEDGATRKLLFTTRDGLPVETVLMPRRSEGWTVCVSSQVGCRVGCTFCRTGEMGLVRNLAAGEIVDQVRWARSLAPGPIRNLVFMGMGEPLENLDAVLDAVEVVRDPAAYAIPGERITLSTSGHLPGLRELGRRDPGIQLAVSWNATRDEDRDRLMPINRRYPLAALQSALRDFPLRRGRSFMIEYVLLAGVNDRPEDADRLATQLAGLPVKLNLIRYNPVPGQPWQRPTPEAAAAFASRLGPIGSGVLERYSWGGGIDAACGQLGAEVLAETRRKAGSDLPVQAPAPWGPVAV